MQAFVPKKMHGDTQISRNPKPKILKDNKNIEFLGVPTHSKFYAYSLGVSVW